MRFRLRRTYSRLRRRTRTQSHLLQVIPLMMMALLLLSLSLSGYYLLFRESALDQTWARALLDQECQPRPAMATWWIGDLSISDPFFIG